MLVGATEYSPWRGQTELAWELGKAWMQLDVGQLENKREMR